MTIGGKEVQTPRFDWTFNFGHVLTSLTIVVAAISGIWAASKVVTDFDHRLAAVERVLTASAPKLDANDRVNERQDERLRAQGEAISGIRSDISDSNRKIGTLAEGVAGLSAKIDTLIRKN